jgi:hypothetical protein
VRNSFLTRQLTRTLAIEPRSAGYFHVMKVRSSGVCNLKRTWIPANEIMTSGAQSFALAKLNPWLFGRGVLPGDFSSHETFGDIFRFQIEMPVDRADFAGDVEARDRFFHRIEGALLDVVLRAALVF